MLKMAAVIPKTHLRIIKKQTLSGVSAAVQICNYSQHINILNNPTTASVKRGTGGRSSFNGITCTVFGNTGFIGRVLCNRLGSIGTQLILPYRGDIYESLPLKLCGDLGQVLFHPFNLKDEDSIKKCIKYSNVVVNLIGRDWETKNYTFNDVHVEGAARLARICKENGVQKFVHVSCLNACSHPEPILLEDGSKFLKSKWQGECEVRKEFPDAIIIRPSDTYGMMDRFIAAYSSKYRMHFFGIPLHKKGEETEKQPVYVGDVGAGIVATILNPESAGRTYQFVGPHRYKLSTLVDWFHEMLRRNCKEHGYRRLDLKWSPLYNLKIMMNDFLPGYPFGYLHWEGLEKESTSDKVIKGVPTLEDLGVVPIAVDNQVQWEIRPFVFDGSYESIHLEFPDIEPPIPINKVQA